MTSHNATRNAHGVMWKWICWQRQRRTCYRVQYHNVACCSIYECLFELSSTTNILHCHLVHNKNTSPPTFLNCTFPVPALTETCFEVNTLGEFAPERSVCTVGGGIQGGGCTCCPCNVIRETSLSTWLPMPELKENIRHEIHNISQNELQKVPANVLKRCEACVKAGSHHFQHL